MRIGAGSELSGVRHLKEPGRHLDGIHRGHATDASQSGRIQGHYDLPTVADRPAQRDDRAPWRARDRVRAGQRLHRHGPRSVRRPRRHAADEHDRHGGSRLDTSPYTVTLHGTDADSGLAGLQWCLNHGAFSDADDGDDITIATSGVWALDTRAVDNEGNVSAWTAETVRVDLAAPADITDPGGTGWHNAPHNVIVLADDPVSGVDHVEYQLDGGLVQSVPNGTSVAISSDGSHTLRTRAVDVAGNTSVWRDHTVRVDTLTPTDTTAAPAAGRPRRSRSPSPAPTATPASSRSSTRSTVARPSRPRRERSSRSRPRVSTPSPPRSATRPATRAAGRPPPSA